MTHADATTHTAKRHQSWHAADPHGIILEIVRDNPVIREADALALFCKRVLPLNASATLQEIVQYYFLDAFRRVMRPVRHRPQVSARAEFKADVDRLERHVAVILSDMIMPNGKPLRDCTGEDCRLFGGWCLRVAESVRPGATIGNSLSEEQLHKLYRVA